MLNDLGNELHESAELELQKLKLEYMTNAYVTDADSPLIFEGNIVSKVDQLVCLGSLIRIDRNEQPTALHRCCKSWGTFHKWKDVLLCQQVTIENRLAFWAKTVQPSLLWGLETNRASTTIQKTVKRTQRHMIIKMLRRKRKHDQGKLEPWLDWHIRVSRDAKQLLINFPHFDIAKQLLNKKQSFAGHVARFGLQEREEHLVKHILLWRNAYWWHLQKKHIANGSSAFKHFKVGKISRWENQFPRNWISKFSSMPDPN